MLDLVAIVLSFVTSALQYLLLAWLYRSFIVPLGAPPVSLPEIVGIRLFVCILAPDQYLPQEIWKVKTKKTEAEKQEDALKSIVTSGAKLLAMAVSVAMGLVCMHFMGGQ